MRRRRVLSFKFILFSLTPLLALVLAAEAAVRVKYFFAHGHDWPYLTTPFGKASWAPANATEKFVGDADPAATQAGQPSAASQAGAAAAATGPSKDQMVFKWGKPCSDQTVFSTALQKPMPRTWDGNCFRGDRVTMTKGPDEYRIAFLGGSTVEDAQSDDEMMAAQFKRAFPPAVDGKRVTVVNAGRAGFESRRISTYWNTTVSRFSPDVALYYEAWNEQPTDVKFMHADDRLGRARDWLHGTLYYNSMLYTYIVEKRAFLNASNDRFWKIDVTLLSNGFRSLAQQMRANRCRFVFVTQVVKFPRMWKGVDTFDYQSVDALLDRLRADRQYSYDVSEVSALNQRLAVGYTLQMCRELRVPVINILDAVEARGETGRAEMFMDLGHLTVTGDRVVGELIASGLTALNSRVQ